MQILERHPGQNTFQPNPNRSATALMQPKDFRGFRGIMLTRGESPELAKAQARAILSHLG